MDEKKEKLSMRNTYRCPMVQRRQKIKGVMMICINNKKE